MIKKQGNIMFPLKKKKKIVNIISKLVLPKMYKLFLGEIFSMFGRLMADINKKRNLEA